VDCFFEGSARAPGVTSLAPKVFFAFLSKQFLIIPPLGLVVSRRSKCGCSLQRPRQRPRVGEHETPPGNQNRTMANFGALQ